jgi:hypothetical protein
VILAPNLPSQYSPKGIRQEIRRVEDKLDSKDLTVMPFTLRAQPSCGLVCRPANYAGWVVSMVEETPFKQSSLVVHQGNRCLAEIPSPAHH